VGLPLVLLGLLFTGGLPSSATGATFEIPPEGFTVGLLDAEGNPEHLAGSHPDLRIDFALTVEESSVRDLAFELPPGLGMNALAVPGCAREVVAAGEECPPQSQVGSFETVLSGGAKTTLPLFALEPPPGQPLMIGTKPGFNLPASTELRPSDFGITVKVSDLPREAIAKGHLELWGIPADHQEGTGIPRRALLSAPTACGPLSFGFQARSWEEGALWLSTTTETEPLTGCESLRFEPRLGVHLSNPVIDAPTGMRTEMSMPEEGDPDERAQAQIKDVSIQMPAGIALSPGGAANLTACSDAQLDLAGSAEAHCPQSSRVGSIELVSPAIDGAMIGTIYMGDEKPGQRFRVFVVAPAAGITVKFVGVLQISAASGRSSTVLQGLPPLSISRMAMSFDGGPQALFATPLTCGVVSAAAKFDSYGGGPPVEASAGATVGADPGGAPCAATAPFSPQLLTTASTHRAGQLTTFSSIVRRRQGEQLPRKLSTTTPAGLSASLGAIQLCSASAASAGACPATSRVGSVIAEIGSAPSTATLRGGLYFTGPYRGAPFGVLMTLPAVIGPFNLGSISTRGTAELNPRSGRLTVSMDRLPGSFEGIPARFRSIELDMDRPGFIRNPTSCAPHSTDAQLEAEGGATATLSSAYEVRGCKGLGFGPMFRMALVGGGELHKGGKPGMRVAVSLHPHEANLRTIEMSLPPALEFALGGIEEICSHRDAASGSCPSGAMIGSVRSRSPLLKKPLKGAIYVAQPRGDGQPDIWTHFSGEGLEVNMRGRSLIRDGSPVLELTGLPDIPLSSFAMRLRQGSQGAITLASRPCVGSKRRHFGADVAAAGQNGARRAFRVGIAMKARCASRSE
jgi:hypothetical protein